MGLTLVGGEYDNSTPRKMKGPALADSFPTLFRLQSAHNNTFECIAVATACFWAAASHAVEPLLFAKLALLVLVSRILYVIAYVLDEDFCRTSLFALASTVIIDIGLVAIFP